MSADSASDGWAVGYSGANFSAQKAIVKHWNGVSWASVPVENPGAELNTLSSVVALSATDVWVVGADGTRFTVVPSPNPDGTYDALRDVTAVSANDVWAVGLSGVDTYVPLIEHWNGKVWRVVPSPSSSGAMLGVTAVSSNDIWAVGAEAILHWNGRHWTVAADTAGVGILDDVSATSATDAWAVGSYNEGGPLVEHWDGTSWSTVLSGLPHCDGGFGGVAAVSSDDVWSVGSCPGSQGAADKTLTSHWDGSSWTTVKSPHPGRNSGFEAVSAVTADDIWGVGSRTGSPGTQKGLFERWNGSSWGRYRHPG